MACGSEEGFNMIRDFMSRRRFLGLLGAVGGATALGWELGAEGAAATGRWR